MQLVSHLAIFVLTKIFMNAFGGDNSVGTHPAMAMVRMDCEVMVESTPQSDICNFLAMCGLAISMQVHLQAAQSHE